MNLFNAIIENLPMQNKTSPTEKNDKKIGRSRAL